MSRDVDTEAGGVVHDVGGRAYRRKVSSIYSASGGLFASVLFPMIHYEVL